MYVMYNNKFLQSHTETQAEWINSELAKQDTIIFKVKFFFIFHLGRKK